MFICSICSLPFHRFIRSFGRFRYCVSGSCPHLCRLTTAVLVSPLAWISHPLVPAFSPLVSRLLVRFCFCVSLTSFTSRSLTVWCVGTLLRDFWIVRFCVGFLFVLHLSGFHTAAPLSLSFTSRPLPLVLPLSPVVEPSLLLQPLLGLVLTSFCYWSFVPLASFWNLTTFSRLFVLPHDGTRFRFRFAFHIRFSFTRSSPSVPLLTCHVSDFVQSLLLTSRCTSAILLSRSHLRYSHGPASHFSRYSFLPHHCRLRSSRWVLVTFPRRDHSLVKRLSLSTVFVGCSFCILVSFALYFLPHLLSLCPRFRSCIFSPFCSFWCVLGSR